MNGNAVVWNLPDLPLLENRGFSINVSLPITATIGTLYPVTMEFDSDGPDANPADNTSSTKVMAALQIYSPIVSNR